MHLAVARRLALLIQGDKLIYEMGPISLYMVLHQSPQFLVCIYSIISMKIVSHQPSGLVLQYYCSLFTRSDEINYILIYINKITHNTHLCYICYTPKKVKLLIIIKTWKPEYKTIPRQSINEDNVLIRKYKLHVYLKNQSFFGLVQHYVKWQFLKNRVNHTFELRYN